MALLCASHIGLRSDSLRCGELWNKLSEVKAVQWWASLLKYQAEANLQARRVLFWASTAFNKTLGEALHIE